MRVKVLKGLTVFAMGYRMFPQVLCLLDLNMVFWMNRH